MTEPKQPPIAVSGSQLGVRAQAEQIRLSKIAADRLEVVQALLDELQHSRNEAAITESRIESICAMTIKEYAVYH